MREGRPQTEDGFTRIADEILDALIKYRIPGEQMQCLLFILRKTYGYKKKSDYISNSQFCKATGLNKPNVCRAIRSLVEKNIVIKKDNRKIPSYQFNKYYKTWKVLSKKITTKKVIKKDNQVLSKKIPTIDTITIEKNKESTKETIFHPKDIKPDFISSDQFKDIQLHRRKVNATNTERSWKSFFKQMTLAFEKGFAIDECIDEMSNRSWKGFKADWMKEPKVLNTGVLSAAGQKTLAAGEAWINASK